VSSEKNLNKTYYTYTNIRKYVKNIATQIKKSDWEPDLIVGLTRGGLVPAVMLSHILDVKMQSLNWSTRDHVENCSDAATAEDAVNGMNILIIDDICDSGHTFRTLKDDWNASVHKDIDWHGSTRFATLDYKDSSDFPIDFTVNSVHDDNWIVYPWEPKHPW
jgi:hypoxanthine phosphoribosyltransferase